MKVTLRNPDREVELAGPKTVRDVLAELGIDPDTVLVIRDRDLVTRAERLDDADQIEIRPVISGGGQPPGGRGSSPAVPGGGGKPRPTPGGRAG